MIGAKFLVENRLKKKKKSKAHTKIKPIHSSLSLESKMKN